MKKGIVLLAVLALAGCAGQGTVDSTASLHTDAYSRGERILPMTFPQIQMALFKHQAACGEAPSFALVPGQTAYARLSDQPLEGADYKQIIVADLTHYRSSDLGGWLEADEDRDWRTRAKVYSYYDNSQVGARIEQMFRAITNPQACPGDPIEPDTAEPSDTE